MTSRDKEMETGRNIHRKRSRELQWSNEASQELLKLRYKTLRALFDEAETVADVHEAWGVVASRLNAMENLEMEELDPVKCSDQLTKLRLLWQDSNTQLQVMMAECFGQQAMETMQEASPKRRKPTEPFLVSPTESQVEDSASTAELEAPLSPEPESNSAAEPEGQVEMSNLQAVQQEPVRAEAQADEEEFSRQDAIMRELEKRSEQLERLAESHQHLAEVTQKLMEALVNQQHFVEEHVSTSSKVKSSQQRSIRSKVLEQYPDLEPYAEMLMPKKAPMVVAKCHNHIQIVLHEGEPVFFNQRDGPFMPTLKLLHKVPHVMKQVRADKGAIPFVLSGANVMCPGLTSAGGDMPESLEAGTPVAIMAEGKEHAMAIGILTLSTDDIRSKNKGVAIEMVHFLGDDLWTCAHID
ncbi:Malignant T-cell-amplified sequence 1 [Phytophthora citrophthora]|uniref:Malignant T-cell-amplified sequence 1 n=1 Tax=Phytophthora citrophthora TaxID=4793 RepID=A0AAD9G3P2_9STRA|nr:Malignant T-cell-amplified sequence 1 [Phytophthora citrophthora]